MVVRMRANRSKTGKRRSHHGLVTARLSKCVCGGLRLAHRACPECGKYNDKVIVDVVAKAERATKRAARRNPDAQKTSAKAK